MAKIEELSLGISGMTCDDCASHVRTALKDLEDVTYVDVPGWRQGKATLRTAEGTPENVIAHAVEAAGYQAKVTSRRKITSSNEGAEHDFDLIVIGTGGAGMAAAIKAAEMGYRAAIVEAGVVGGTCVNVGCVPSKALLRAAEAAHVAGRHPFAGVDTRLEKIDWSTIIQQKNELVESLRQHKYVDVISAYPDNIELIHGWARLEGDGAVDVDGKRYRGNKIVIATGAHPKMLPIPGADEVYILDSTAAMELTERPESLLVIGGRFIALEQAQIFARFGTKVTVLQRSERLIPDHEPEIADAITEYFREEGIEVETGVTLLSVREEGGQKVLEANIGGIAREFRADQVMMAVGRIANTGNLGLEKADVALDDSGAIIVDDALRTSNPDIFAAGDVTNRPQLIYVAAAAGGIAADNALNGGERKLDLATLPDVIFTDPQVAQVGWTESQAKAHGYGVKTTVLPLEYVPRAIAARNTRGLIKLVADQESDRLLGASVLAAEGGEVIQTAAMAVHCGRKYGFTVQDMREMLFPYLVQVEGLKLAALTFEKDVSQLSCCAA